MKSIIGLAIGFAIGGACRAFGVPLPAPPVLVGAFLVAQNRREHAMGALPKKTVLATEFIRAAVLPAGGVKQAGIAWALDQAAVEVPRHDANASKLWAMIGRCDGWMGLRL